MEQPPSWPNSERGVPIAHSVLRLVSEPSPTPAYAGSDVNDQAILPIPDWSAHLTFQIPEGVEIVSTPVKNIRSCIPNEAVVAYRRDQMINVSFFLPDGSPASETLANERAAYIQALLQLPLLSLEIDYVPAAARMAVETGRPQLVARQVSEEA